MSLRRTQWGTNDRLTCMPYPHRQRLSWARIKLSKKTKRNNSKKLKSLYFIEFLMNFLSKKNQEETSWFSNQSSFWFSLCSFIHDNRFSFYLYYSLFNFNFTPRKILVKFTRLPMSKPMSRGKDLHPQLYPTPFAKKPGEGFEPTTYCLQNSCSSAELSWQMVRDFAIELPRQTPIYFLIEFLISFQ